MQFAIEKPLPLAEPIWVTKWHLYHDDDSDFDVSPEKRRNRHRTMSPEPTENHGTMVPEPTENPEPEERDGMEDAPDLKSDATSQEQDESGEECSSSGESEDSVLSEGGEAEDAEGGEGQDDEDENSAEETNVEEESDVPAHPERRLCSAGSVGPWSKALGRIWGSANVVVDKSGQVHDELNDMDDLPLDPEKAMLTKDGPRNVKEALKDLRWREAIQKEYDQMMNVNAWDLVRLPPGRRALPF